MKQLFRILLAVTLVTAMAWACKKTQPESTFVLEATVEGEALYDGTGEISYNVKSTKKIGEKEEFMPWTMEFSTDNGNTWTTTKPDFITLTTQENNGGTEAKTYTATFAAQVKTIGGTSADILKSRQILSDLDLSMVDVLGNPQTKGKSTANCYVIHNPGTYKFPTVYGNSIKSGVTNESAYTSSMAGHPDVLANFINAYGDEIIKPGIDKINNACLIWQDTKDLLTEIKYDAETDYVSFKVKKETIHNGNAIIAVRDASNTILWSWHIWVTEEDLTPVEITNYQGHKYDLMPINIGWCGDGNTTSYAQREVKVKIKQKDSDKIVELALTQKVHCEGDRKAGNCTFYQWGRKDPMLPSDGTDARKDKDCFTTDIQYAFQHTGLETDDIKEYIRNPHKFNIKDKMDGKYLNLWNMNNTQTSANDYVVVKTVYDPSPVGYTVPAPNMFTGFTSSGQNSGNSSEWNVQDSFDKGWHFYRKPNKQGHTIFFPACGYRYYNSGALNYVSEYGNCWAAGPHVIDQGRGLYFSASYIVPLNANVRSYALTIRSAKEK